MGGERGEVKGEPTGGGDLAGVGFLWLERTSSNRLPGECVMTGVSLVSTKHKVWSSLHMYKKCR